MSYNNNSLLIFFLVLVCLFQSVLSRSSITFFTNRRVILIRHAEKPPFGNDLSERGWLRAECISELFQKNKTFTPKKIYAQRAANHKKEDENLPDSRRQIQTVGPLARALNLVVDNSFHASEVKELAKNISELPLEIDPVLVSWNHEDMRKFLINFGMNYRTAPKYPKNRYDLIWVIYNETDPNTGEPKFEHYSQNCAGLGDYRFNKYNKNKKRDGL